MAFDLKLWSQFLFKKIFQVRNANSKYEVGEKMEDKRSVSEKPMGNIFETDLLIQKLTYQFQNHSVSIRLFNMTMNASKTQKFAE